MTPPADFSEPEPAGMEPPKQWWPAEAQRVTGHNLLGSLKTEERELRRPVVALESWLVTELGHP